MKKLKIVIPKGRMYDHIASLFKAINIKIDAFDRHYFPMVSDPEIEAKIMKPQNIATLIEMGAHDAGFTGKDWIVESGAAVEEVLDLGFDPVKIIAAVPACYAEEDLRKKGIVVATEYAKIAKKFLDKAGYDYRLLRTYGATEAYPPDDADMIVENMSTGYTLKKHKLRVIAEIMSSSTRFVVGKAVLEDPRKREKIEELKMLFQSVLMARGRVMLEMNVPVDKLEAVVKVLPCMRVPTVSKLYADQGYAVKAAVPPEQTVKLIPKLKKMGASDILEYEIRKVIP